jgi:hypothetical protein
MPRAAFFAALTWKSSGSRRAPSTAPKALLVVVLLCSILAAAQTSSPAKDRKARAAAYRSECLHSVGFCISVPAAWQRLGDVFGDFGFVAAEPHAGADPATWPQLTVAAIDLAAKEDGGTAAPVREPATSPLDVLVERMLTPEGAFASARTLERSRLLLNGASAQIVRVELRDDTGKPDAVEKIALIEGEDGLVYSIALRCAPRDFERLAPVFDQAARSWRLQTAQATPAQATPSSSPPRSTAPAPSQTPGVSPQAPNPNRIPNP